MPYTSAEALAYIPRQLGAPNRRVELSPENLQDALRFALERYASIKPIFAMNFFPISMGVQGYNLGSTGNNPLNLPYGNGVVRCFQQPITSPQAVFTEFEYFRLRQPPYVDMTELLVDQMYYKEIGLLTGTQWDWEWIPESSMILITPGPTYQFNVAYEYTVPPTKIEQVPPYDQYWILKYAVRSAKQVLGRVRGKFQGVPGNDLPINTDFQSLLSEGSDEELTKLEEELWKTRGDFTGPIKG